MQWNARFILGGYSILAMLGKEEYDQSRMGFKKTWTSIVLYHQLYSKKCHRQNCNASSKNIPLSPLWTETGRKGIKGATLSGWHIRGWGGNTHELATTTTHASSLTFKIISIQVDHPGSGRRSATRLHSTGSHALPANLPCLPPLEAHLGADKWRFRGTGAIALENHPPGAWHSINHPSSHSVRANKET